MNRPTWCGWDNVARACVAADCRCKRAEFTEDQWLALAERHLNADWNSDQPDGYFNAVKALVRDALSTAGVSSAGPDPK
jgi:hypothetical protein